MKRVKRFMGKFGMAVLPSAAVVLLCAGLIFTSCDNDPGEEKSTVSLSVPKVSELPSYNGNFAFTGVNDPTLKNSLLNVIGLINGSGGSRQQYSYQPSNPASRAMAPTEIISYTFRDDASLIPDALVTADVSGYEKYPNGDVNNLSASDYSEQKMNEKLAITFDGSNIKGKYAIDMEIYSKLSYGEGYIPTVSGWYIGQGGVSGYGDLNPGELVQNIVLDIKQNAAYTVNLSGSGYKLLINTDVRIDQNSDLSEWNTSPFDYIKRFNVSYKIYNNTDPNIPVISMEYNGGTNPNSIALAWENYQSYFGTDFISVGGIILIDPNGNIYTDGFFGSSGEDIGGSGDDVPLDPVVPGDYD